MGLAGCLQPLTGVPAVDDFATTNLLLGIIAGVQLVFLLGVLIAGLYLRRTVTQVGQTVTNLEREHVRPLQERVERILDDATRVSARVVEQSARIDADLSGSLDVAERQARRLASAVNVVARETTAVASGVRAAVAAVSARLASDARSLEPRARATVLDDEAMADPDVPSSIRSWPGADDLYTRPRGDQP
jgi:hypothetical protein